MLLVWVCSAQVFWVSSSKKPNNWSDLPDPRGCYHGGKSCCVGKVGQREWEDYLGDARKSSQNHKYGQEWQETRGRV